MPDNGIVYHYCSLETFKSIIENKCLWLCDVQKSNDSKECLVLPEKICKLAKQNNLRDKCPPAQRPLLDRIFHFLMNKPIAVYTVCFTSKRDDLNQWRGYAADGAGLCIGFRRKFFQAMKPATYRTLKYRPVIYSEVRLNRTAVSFLGKIEKLIQKFVDNGWVKDDIEAQLSSNIFLHDVWRCSPEFKKSSFREESERRIILAPDTHITDYRSVKLQKNSVAVSLDTSIRHQFSLYENVFSLSDLKYRTTRGTLQGYYELSFDAIADDLIAEIIIGPKCPLTEEDVFLFLAANQLRRQIKRDDPLDVSRSVFPKDLLNVCTSALSYR